MTNPISPHSDLPAWLRCTCCGSCAVDIPVTLRVGRTDAPPEIVAWPDRCPETGAELHYAPDTSPMVLWNAWYDAVNQAVTEGTAPIPALRHQALRARLTDSTPEETGR